MNRFRQSEHPAKASDREASARVLFLGGSGKSGSTLLGALLGQLPGLFNVGELRNFWSEVADGQARCGCGVVVGRCDFWSRIMVDLEAEMIDIRRMAELTDRLDKTRRLGRVVMRSFRPHVAAEWDELRSGTRHLYEAVSRHCGGRYIVDGSKIPTHFLLLRGLPGFDTRLLHLVRDGRAVAYSWERKRRRRKVSSGGMRRLQMHGAAASDLMGWMFQNTVIASLGSSSPRQAVLRYEDLADATGAALMAILTELTPDLALTDADMDAVALGPTHAIAGSNRVRFAEPGTPITLDEAWRREVSHEVIRAWSLLAAPVLHRFGYPIW